MSEDSDEPNKLQGVDLQPLSVNPSLAVVVLDTDRGQFDFAVNRTVAGMLITKLVEYLALRDEEAQEIIDANASPQN